MTSLFSKKQDAKEVLRECKRDMSSAQRGIEREILHLQNEEKKLLVEIKRTAKSGNQAATRSLAKELVRVRASTTKLQGNRAQIRGVSTKAQSMHANQSIANAMKASGEAMAAVNKQMSPAETMKVMQKFQMENAKMDMAQEMMGDTMDDAFDEDGIDEETDELTNQVLDEIGVDMAAQLTHVPKTRLSARRSSQEEPDSAELGDLERRLRALKN